MVEPALFGEVLPYWEYGQGTALEIFVAVEPA